MKRNVLVLGQILHMLRSSSDGGDKLELRFRDSNLCQVQPSREHLLFRPPRNERFIYTTTVCSGKGKDNSYLFDLHSGSVEECTEMWSLQVTVTETQSHPVCTQFDLKTRFHYMGMSTPSGWSDKVGSQRAKLD